LQGTEALQFGFKTAGRNPEEHEQQLRGKKYHPPLGATESHYAFGCFLHTLTIMPGIRIMQPDKKQYCSLVFWMRRTAPSITIIIVAGRNAEGNSGVDEQ